MKNSHCPKCGSNDIYDGSKIFNKSGGHNSNSIPLSLFTHATLDNYVCGQCGYVESYVAERSKLEKIIESWPRAQRG